MHKTAGQSHIMGGED